MKKFELTIPGMTNKMNSIAESPEEAKLSICRFLGTDPKDEKYGVNSIKAVEVFDEPKSYVSINTGNVGNYNTVCKVEFPKPVREFFKDLKTQTNNGMLNGNFLIKYEEGGKYGHFFTDDANKVKGLIKDYLQQSIEKNGTRMVTVLGEINKINDLGNRLKDSDTWLKDKEKNQEVLRVYDNKLKHIGILNRTVAADYEKTTKDLELDEKFIKRFGILDREQYNREMQKYSIDKVEGERLRDEYKELEVNTESLDKSLKQLTEQMKEVTKNISKVLSKDISFDR